MNFEPQKFFIGLTDFFSILLPGALVALLLQDKAGPALLGAHYGTLPAAAGWALFFLASYLAGHFVFLIGSWLDGFYHALRRRTVNCQIETVVRHGRLTSWPLRLLVWLLFKHENDGALRCANAIRMQALAPLGAQKAVNTFQWSKVFLASESPENLATVQRFEADSKFFRSFVVVLLLVILSWPWLRQAGWSWAGFLVPLGLLPLAFWRYGEQRLKATSQAYWAVITLIGAKAEVKVPCRAKAPGAPSHAGGVVFRKRGGSVHYLMVTATEDDATWVLPKGHVEVGETARETAVREILEEAGVWARPYGNLGVQRYVAGGETVAVHYFLMEAIGRGRRTDRDRKHAWMKLDSAVGLANRQGHAEAAAMLAAAEARRTSPPAPKEPDPTGT